MKYQNTLEVCIQIANERQEHYGDPKQNFEEVREILKITFGLDLTLEQICKVMLAVKLSREKNKHKADNLLDLINYTAILSSFMDHE